MQRIAALSLLSLGCGAALAGDPLVVNGSFDLFVPANSTGGGWTSGGQIDGAGGWRESGGDPGAFFILNAGGQTDTDPTLLQVIGGLNPGTTYVLEGSYASWNLNLDPGDAVDSFEVLIDGIAIVQAGPGPQREWRRFSVEVEPSSSSLTLEIRAEAHGSDNDFAVDSISLSGDEPDCVADLAEPFGVLDFSDVIFFLGAFSVQLPEADFAEPFGVWDFSDVVAFLSAFGNGCP